MLIFLFCVLFSVNVYAGESLENISKEILRHVLGEGVELINDNFLEIVRFLKTKHGCNAFLQRGEKENNNAVNIEKAADILGAH